MEVGTQQADNVGAEEVRNGNDNGRSNASEEHEQRSDHSSDVEWQADEWRDDDDGFRANTQPHEDHNSSSEIQREVEEVQDLSKESPKPALDSPSSSRGPRDTPVSVVEPNGT